MSMYGYSISLCIAVLLHRSVALDGYNETCSSILAHKGSGKLYDDCNAGITAEFFKCVSALSNCDDVGKSRIAEQSIAKYYPHGITGLERYLWICTYHCSCNWYTCWCWYSCSPLKRDTNETITEIPLTTCSEGVC